MMADDDGKTIRIPLFRPGAKRVEEFLDDLSKIKACLKSNEKYRGKETHILPRCEEILINQFIAGLNEPYASIILRMRAKTLLDAVEYANLQYCFRQAKFEPQTSSNNCDRKKFENTSHLNEKLQSSIPQKNDFQPSHSNVYPQNPLCNYDSKNQNFPQKPFLQSPLRQNESKFMNFSQKSKFHTPNRRYFCSNYQNFAVQETYYTSNPYDYYPNYENSLTYGNYYPPKLCDYDEYYQDFPSNEDYFPSEPLYDYQNYQNFPPYENYYPPELCDYDKYYHDFPSNENYYPSEPFYDDQNFSPYENYYPPEFCVYDKYYHDFPPNENYYPSEPLYDDQNYQNFPTCENYVPSHIYTPAETIPRNSYQNWIDFRFEKFSPTLCSNVKKIVAQELPFPKSTALKTISKKRQENILFKNLSSKQLNILISILNLRNHTEWKPIFEVTYEEDIQSTKFTQESPPNKPKTCLNSLTASTLIKDNSNKFQPKQKYVKAKEDYSEITCEPKTILKPLYPTETDSLNNTNKSVDPILIKRLHERIKQKETKRKCMSNQDESKDECDMDTQIDTRNKPKRFVIIPNFQEPMVKITNKRNFYDISSIRLRTRKKRVRQKRFIERDF